MFSTDQDNPLGVEESYASAIQSSNLRLETREGAPLGAISSIIAAGWNSSRVGGALMRLLTEFDRAERPRTILHSDLLPLLVAEAAGRAKDGKLTQHEKAQLKAHAKRMALEQNYERISVYLCRLREFPIVRHQLALKLAYWRADDALTKATQVLRWWLEQQCTSCHGQRFLVIAGTGRLSNKACPTCSANGGNLGEKIIPHGAVGKRLVCHIARCVEDWRSQTKRSLRG